jgi:hypothetical protein
LGGRRLVELAALHTKGETQSAEYSHRWEALSCRSASRKSQQQRAASERSYKAFVRELCWKLSESSTEKADVVVRRPKTARLAQGERQNEWNGNF